MNVNALIDCLQSMKFPEEGVSKIVLALELKNFSNAKMLLVNSLLVAVEAVNQREIDRNRKHSIVLYLS